MNVATESTRRTDIRQRKEQANRTPRKYSVPGMCPGRPYDTLKREAIGMGLRCALEGATASAGTVALPTPWAQAACVAWFDAAQPQTLGAMYPSGTTPPAVTISGSQSVWSPVGIRVEITTLGTNGVAQFRVSYDSGATFAHSTVTVPIGNTYALDGAATGFTLNFPTATSPAYAANNVYEASGTSAPSLKTGTDILAQSGTAAPRLYIGASGILSRASWKGDGAATAMRNAGVVWPSPTVGKFFLYGVAQCTAVGAGFGNIWCADTGATPNGTLTNSTTFACNNGSTISNTNVVLGTPKRFYAAFTGNVADRVVWGSVSQSGTLGNTAPGTAGFDLFSRFATASTFFNGLIACCGLFSGDPATGGLLTTLDAWVTGASGGAGFTGGSALTS